MVWTNQQPLLVSGVLEERRWPHVIGLMKEDGTKSFCFVPLTTARARLGAMGFLSVQEEAYSEKDLEFLGQGAKQVAVAVENVLAFQEIAQLKGKLAEEKMYLEEELCTEQWVWGNHWRQ
jgi:formate hydrogenlyase transcriptional activator